MEKIKDYRLDPHAKCPACVIGKISKQYNPGSIPWVSMPLGKVNFNVIVSSITSIKGYNYGSLFADNNEGYRWLYGIKTLDAIVAKRWMAKIAEPREGEDCTPHSASDQPRVCYGLKHQLVCGVRRCTGNTYQLTFDELFCQYWKESLIKRLDNVEDEIDILFKASSPIKWLEYDPAVYPRYTWEQEVVRN